MRVLDVITESVDEEQVDEISFTRKGRAKKAARKSVSDEVKDLATELAAWMEGSGIKKGKLTADDLESFLQKKGYGGAAKKVLSQVRREKGDSVGSKIKKGAKGVSDFAKSTADKWDKAAKADANIRDESVMEASKNYLSSSEIKKVLKQVVQMGFKQKATPDKKGRYAFDKDDSGETHTPTDDEAKMIQDLERRGYEVTKKG